MKKKEILTIIILGIIVIVIIMGINYFKNGKLTEKQAICISKKSILIVSKTCGHCANQKRMLEPYLDLFNISYVDDNPELWDEYELVGVPTWIINNKQYPGVRSINELKKITNCRW